MGIHGLTTYLRENQQLLAKPLRFDSSGSSVTNLVVDAWSFIYELFQFSNLDWVYGGEHDQFYRMVISVVRSWISVGLKLYFVFDGPYTPLKFNTVMSRLTATNVRSSLLFFRTSSLSRSTPRFLNESRILPPLYYLTCVQALKSVARLTPSVEIHFAPEEADPYAVELAGKLNAYVTGYDSDFVVLNTDGYQGYIPMEDFFWSSSMDVSETTTEADDQVSDFQPVRRRKKTKQQTGVNQGIIPPEGSSDLVLSCPAYSPSVLAAHLDIPVTLLPLLGALVGNDFSASNRSAHSMFFHRDLTHSQRITRVSTTLRTILVASSGPKRKQKQVSSVMDLIRRTVVALLVRDVSRIPSVELEATIEKIVESTLQYAIPKREDGFSKASGPVCLLRGSVEGSLVPSLSGFPDSSTVIRALYNDAYQKGNLYPVIVDILHSGTFWPRIFLENPDAESVAKTIGRQTREWLYAILDDGVGLPEKVEAKPSEPSEPDEDDELIDVVEEDSSDEDDELFDPLAPLRGALERLEGDSLPLAFSLPSVARKPKSVDEFVRRGTRVAPDEVRVAPLSALLSHLPIPFSTPVQMSPEPVRYNLLLNILSSYPALGSINTLPNNQIIPVLAIRLVLQALYERTLGSPRNKDKLSERWTKREINALLLAFVGPPDPEFLDDDESSLPEIHDRHLQLTAQILAALESVILLSQVLLFDDERLPLTLVNRFSGKRFHALLNRGLGKGTTNRVSEGVSSELWTSVAIGFEDDVFGEDRGKKARKERKEIKRREQKQVGNVLGGAKGTVNRGMFGLLANFEA